MTAPTRPPVPGHVRPVPLWAVVSAGLTPAVLVCGWVIAGLLRAPAYSPVRETVSALAGQGVSYWWIVTASMFAACAGYLVTAAGLAPVRLPGRLMLVLAGTCSVGIATSPEMPGGPGPVHLAWTVLGALTIAAWPLAAAWRPRVDPPVPPVLAVRTAIVVAAVFAAMLVWVLAQAQGGSLLGLAERTASTAQTAWPFAVALALRGARSQPWPGPGGDR